VPHLPPAKNFTARLDDQVTTRRKCVTCCVNAQADYRSYLVEFLINAQDAIVNVLEAGILPIAPVIRTPVAVRLPQRRPFFKEKLDVAPSTIATALAQVDIQGIQRVVSIIEQLKSPFDCEHCCEPLFQRHRAVTIEYSPLRGPGKQQKFKATKRLNPRKF